LVFCRVSLVAPWRNTAIATTRSLDPIEDRSRQRQSFAQITSPIRWCFDDWLNWSYHWQISQKVTIIWSPHTFFWTQQQFTMTFSRGVDELTSSLQIAAWLCP
jgi:hypothetical protein